MDMKSNKTKLATKEEATMEDSGEDSESPPKPTTKGGSAHEDSSCSLTREEGKEYSSEDSALAPKEATKEESEYHPKPKSYK